ncbi:type II toxin-antitoxin system RelE family toxin [Sedimenticola hydrogenitrophicus]|uniref:type II toxin-antitoxin system RelE family toxin n=1 Tax=Sedimenticola hydrogenitrophicus TaxID=2967975 RepID=UPI0023AF627D|nr:type II toxin-antitoxin system RelE/ParE family toxin [Sedimenticola hydrogenitrophicus]
MNTLTWTNKARKQLLKIQRQDAARIYAQVGALADFPHCDEVKRLTNHRYDYRLRVGRYRVFFNHDGAVRIISIEEVKKRDERTY